MEPNFEPKFNNPPTANSNQSVKPNLPPPVPNALKRDHSMPVGEQHVVDVNNLPKNAGSNLFASDNSNLPPVENYDFIANYHS